MGQELVLQSIKEGDNAALTTLIKRFSSVDEDLIRSLKDISTKELLNPVNNSLNTPNDLAKEVVGNLTKRREVLGEAIGNKRKQFLGDIDKPDVSLSDLSTQIDTLMRNNQFIQGIKQSGFQRKEPIRVAGVAQLKQLADRFKGVKETVVDSITGKTVFEATGEKVGFKFLSKANAVSVNNEVDILIEAIQKNKNAPFQVKEASLAIRKLFKDKYYQQLDIIDETKTFSNFAELTDDITLEGSNALSSMETFIKNLSSSTVEKRNRLFNAINGIPTKQTGNLVRRIQNFDTVNRFKGKFNAGSTFGKLKGALDNLTFLKQAKLSTQESFLREIDTFLKGSTNKNIASRAFVKEAEKSVAARQFLSDRASIMRVSMIAGMGSVAWLFSGPLVGTATAVAAAKLTNPKSIARFLVFMDKKIAKDALAKEAAKKANAGIKLTPKQIQQRTAILRSLISRSPLSPATKSSESN